MCSVSYISYENQTIITSNRDERLDRKPALSPMWYTYHGQQVYFPRDCQAYGTWFAVLQSGDVFVLLNGAQYPHQSKPPYARSRGLVLLDIATSEHVGNQWDLIDLNKIEPFTLVAHVDHRLYQMRWDGKLKQMEVLNPREPHLWQSSTLYPVEFMRQREGLFKQFVHRNAAELTPREILSFHRLLQIPDNWPKELTDSRRGVATRSLTQVVLEKEFFSMLHSDLTNGTEAIHTYHFQT